MPGLDLANDVLEAGGGAEVVEEGWGRHDIISDPRDDRPEDCPRFVRAASSRTAVVSPDSPHAQPRPVDVDVVRKSSIRVAYSLDDSAAPISWAARTPEWSAPCIQPGQGEVCSPAK